MQNGLWATLLVLAATGMSLLPADHSDAQSSGRSDLPALVVLVRHADVGAERGGDDAHLTAAGIKRAEDLAAALQGTKFSAIITSQRLRTRETAQPIAAALGLTPEVVPVNKDYVTAVEAALRKHKGGSVLVVSHSQRLPAIIAALGGPHLPAICESVFDDLFVLVPTPENVQVVQSRYGAVSPTRGPDCK